MAAGYEGTPQQFTDAHVKVVTVKEDVEGELKNLWGAISALQSQWSGPAQKEFLKLMGRFDTDAKNLNTALEGIAEQLAANGSRYAESEAAQSDVFGGLASALNPE
jgi:WXG100 family type VII secretion target